MSDSRSPTASQPIHIVKNLTDSFFCGIPAAFQTFAWTTCWAHWSDSFTVLVFPSHQWSKTPRASTILMKEALKGCSFALIWVLTQTVQPNDDEHLLHSSVFLYRREYREDWGLAVFRLLGVSVHRRQTESGEEDWEGVKVIFENSKWTCTWCIAVM